jgi:folate-binding protein YgfZ
MTQDMLNLSDPRASIQLTGPDSRKFLQGQVTCDITLLNSNQPILGAHCNAKGRVIFLFTARCNEQDTIVLEAHASIADIAISSLKKYAVFFKTAITDISEERGTDSSLTNLQRIRAGSADVTAATTDMFIPQMLNLDALGYISFKKGCYTGQEIVARAHYRGAVKRRMHHLALPLTELPHPGDDIKDGAGKSIGNIASAARATASTVEVLAVLADSADGCSEMQIGEQSAVSVVHLPLPYTIPTTP